MILRRRWLPLAAVALLTAVVFSPSITTPPSFDQLNFFLERHHSPAFPGIHGLDLSLTRPLFFLWLAIEYVVFGVDFRLWHAANILLHVVVVSALYFLLRQCQPRWSAAALAALFAVRWPVVPLVGDPYLGGSLLAVALVVVSLNVTFRELELGPEYSAGAWLMDAALRTVAVFCFEVAVLTSFVQAAVFSIRTRSGGGWRPLWLPLALFSPIVAFGFVYVWRLPQMPRLTVFDAGLGSNPLSFASLGGFFASGVVTLARMLERTLFPAFRSEVVGSLRDAGGRWLSASVIAANLCAVGGMLAVAAQSLRPLWKAPTWDRTVTLLLMIVGYVSFVGFGRGVQDDSHLYLFSLLFVTLAGFIVDTAVLSPTARQVGIASLLLSIAVNSAVSFGGMTREGRRGSEEVRYLAALDDFTTSHEDERGFSFALDPVPPVDRELTVTMRRGAPDRAGSAPVEGPARALFGARRDPQKALYVLRWNGEMLSVARGPSGAD